MSGAAGARGSPRSAAGERSAHAAPAAPRAREAAAGGDASTSTHDRMGGSAGGGRDALGEGWYHTEARAAAGDAAAPQRAQVHGPVAWAELLRWAEDRLLPAAARGALDILTTEGAMVCHAEATGNQWRAAREVLPRLLARLCAASDAPGPTGPQKARPAPAGSPSPVAHHGSALPHGERERMQRLLAALETAPSPAPPAPAAAADGGAARDVDSESQGTAGGQSGAAGEHAHWFYLDAEHAQHGPVPDAALLRLAAGGRIAPATLLWSQRSQGGSSEGGSSAAQEWTSLKSLVDKKVLPDEVLAAAARVRDAAEAATVAAARAPTPSADEAQWHYVDKDGTQCGPVAIPALKRLVADGAIDGLTLVWRDGMAAWAPLAEQDALREALLHTEAADGDSADKTPEGFIPATQFDGPRVGFVFRNGANGMGYYADAAARAADAPAAPPTGNAAKRRRKRRRKEGAWVNPSKAGNTWVYVEGLPGDVTREELAEHFRIGGIIRTDPATGGPKIKLYTDESGKCKGDASICYAAPESVGLAINMRDGVELRPGVPLSVSRAVFTRKEGVDGKRRALDRKAAKIGRLADEAKMSWAEGSDDEAEGGPSGLRIVVLRHMFGPADAADAGFVDELRAEVHAECSALGRVEKVTVFPNHPDGVVVVKFKRGGGAAACVEKMDGRYFARRRIECSFWDGRENFGRARREGGGSGDGGARSGEVSEEARLEAFGAWLEGDDEQEDESLRVVSEVDLEAARQEETDSSKAAASS